MSGHKSFGKVVSNWIGEHQWPKGSDQLQSIVVVTKRNSAGTVFEFQSAFGYLQIDGAYDKDANSLADVHIQVVAPGYHKAITVAEAASYPISTEEGALVSFDLDNGYVKGSVSFKYDRRNGRRDIFATYDIHLPYTADRKDTVDISPTEITEASGFTVAQLEDIAPFTPPELKELEEKVLVSSKSGKPVILAPNATNENGSSEEQALFVKFLKDFVVEQDGVIIETYYPPSDEENESFANTNAKSLFIANSDKSSEQWHATISFLGVLELVASVDPKKLTISATLNLKVPVIGPVRLAGVQGSLLGAGVTADINIAVAKGKVTFTASKNKSGKHELFADGEINIKNSRTVKTNGKQRIATLPF